MTRTRKEWLQACENTKLDTSEFSDPHRKYEGHIFIVYMHRNKINSKVYVGITHHVNPYKRWGYSGQKYTHCNKFLNAIHKYGWNNFQHIILCRTNRDRAILLEKALIAYYKRKNMSYNLADGGEGSNAVSDTTKTKLHKIISANPPMKGKHHTLEARRKISEAGKKRVYTEEQKRQIAEIGRKTLLRIGWKRSKESIQKQSEKLSKPVLQLDLNGHVLREFSSTIVADKFCHGGKRHNHIADVCNGKRKTDAGFRWVYKEDYERERRTV